MELVAVATPGSAWWLPDSEGELSGAIAAGLLQETHFLELKQEIPNGPGANKELARDLSSLAIDGGTLIVGIAEQDEDLVLHPVTLAGLPERIEQVSRSLVDPPIALSVTTIPSSENAALGYVAVSVHPSLLAPHMVDHRYYGRGDKTKYQLSDGEVVRLHEARAQSQSDAEVILDWLIARDPVPTEIRQHAHFFFVARPTRPRSRLTVDLVRRPDYWDGFRGLLDRAAGSVPASSGRAPTPLTHMTTAPARRSDGIALTSSSLTQDRRLREDGFDPESITEVELSEEGEVRIFLGELSRHRPPSFGDEAGEEVVFDEWVPELVRQGIAVANHVGQDFDYRGPWLIAVAMTGIAGLVTASSVGNLRREPHRLESTANDYRMWLPASADDLAKRPGTLTGDLIGRFLRSTGIERVHLDGLLSDPT